MQLSVCGNEKAERFKYIIWRIGCGRSHSPQISVLCSREAKLRQVDHLSERTQKIHAESRQAVGFLECYIGVLPATPSSSSSMCLSADTRTILTLVPTHL